MAAREDEERVLRRRLRGAMGRDAAEDALIGMAYHGLAVADAAELTALRAVAEAARKLMDVDCFPDEIGSSLEWQAVEAAIAALDRVREGGGESEVTG